MIEDMTKLEARIYELKHRIGIFWLTAQEFINNRDAHGIHDMGVEIQALERAIAELEALDD